MIWIHLLIVLTAILLGARLGGIAIGFVGGLGVLALALLGVSPGDMPLDVISIIMSVICAIAAMQVAGGMDYLVNLAEKLLRKNPKHLTILAPVVTYLMTLMAGTGHTAFSTMPVITEVAKENDIRPSRPLSVAVVASQIAITASPISAAVVFFSSTLEKQGIGYLQVLGVAIPSTFIACMLTAFTMMLIDKFNPNSPLHKDPIYQERLAAGTVESRKHQNQELAPNARTSVLIFLIGLVAVMGYATAISDKVGLIENPPMTRDQAIIAFMLTIAAAIVLISKVPASDVLNASTFKSGMSASICVLGVAWLGTTFVHAHTAAIKGAAGTLLTQYPWLLAVVLFFAASLLYSQAATAKALMPSALALGVAPGAALAAFPAVSALFVLPTYPTLLAAVEMDDTGSTRIGKAVFNHPFLIPGVLAITYAVTIGFALAHIII
ncbi:anaerobic C4-dicarboxylate transporter [Dermatophilus congolensis]|uniref:C4-dicarboxylate transporter DcuA n=1 Tax=Dermatophilus congolensis TaxID=1863 RepID=A0A239VHZ0_9MICO|nr:anaerobic C4-dicarboxylate transporter [Dermatophilus congolensis]MBO3128942.1 anaerobic C4-dicarboxylate transporter [Dermatophilus congolensis]MBO3132420.1 anaerobic C4-dicarboxylate transporter [Dermatophilus congolensis]MBO3133419.1 anaerobic C4-dicarboxylate transporter [Dermatophilus congolensis]MBO3135654.1 anaerobic C4-dicarboxylate transporter [Dermatophilus congolensis]MBO3137893.1 anaerobic C4-dicarboxylate transporter [Dermatophilus congolensis]